MRKIYNSIMAACLVGAAFTTTSCIEEAFPTQGVTDEMLSASSKATEALLWAMPAKMVDYNGAVNGDYHDDYMTGTVMHMRDVMGDEYVVTTSGYDWYTSWEFNQYLGEDYMNAQLVWQTFYKQILTANNLIGAIDPESASDAQKGMLGAGYAYRAFNYLDAARMYEFLPNDGTSPWNSKGRCVQGLTIPIVTEATTEKMSRYNPRADHYAMFKFIMDDLNKADSLIKYLTISDKTIPHLNVVYGLKARAYLWHASFLEEFGKEGVPSNPYAGKNDTLTAEDAYKLARVNARLAIDEGINKPLTREEWLSTTDGFNNKKFSSWMLAMTFVKEGSAVQSGICNWASWISNETTFGYASAGPIVKASTAFYEGISDKDFRKLSYKAPAGSKLAGQEQRLVDDETWETYPDYASLKFRPGQGNMEDYNVGAAVDVPLMRVEEMYFIEAEAAAHENQVEAKNMLNEFMKKYRYSDFDLRSEEKETVIAAIIKQKKIEFWGEGINFFDTKRLNLPVTRIYEGTNFGDDALFNTTTRPAWMNWCMIKNEGTNNEGVAEWNNPDPSDCYGHSLNGGSQSKSNPFEANAKLRGLKKNIPNLKK